MLEHEQTTSNWSEQQAFIAELSQIALTSPSLVALFDKTVHRVREILKADFCKLLEYDLQSQTLLLRAGAGWKKGLVGKAQLNAGVESQAGYTLLSDHPIVVDDLSQEQRFHASPLLIEHGVKSGTSVVIKGYERPYGVLSVHSQKSRHFNLGDANFVQSIANILAGFIQRSSIETELRNLNTSLESQVEERTRLLRFLQDVTVMAHETSSITEATSIFLDMVRSFTGWQIGHLLVIAEQDIGTIHKDGYLSLIPLDLEPGKNRNAALIQKARENIHFEQGDSLAGAAWKKGAPVLLEDISRQPIVGREVLVVQV
jgi:transcriptional regulator with GAF, ATPase, and Fis domain